MSFRGAQHGGMRSLGGSGIRVWGLLSDHELPCFV